MPYWDITTDLPDRLQHPPFDRYVLPLDPGATATPPVTGFADYTTQRHSVAEIAANLKQNGVVDDLRTSLVQSVYGRSNKDGYMNFAVQGHDGGHGSIGPTMAQVLVASYDPVFWFFHCNLDRLWLSWQTRVGGTTLSGFRTTLGGVTAWLDQPLKGYPSVKASDTIETAVTYDRLDLPATTEGEMENLTGHVAAARSFAFRSSSPVSVRVKDINRMNIPGSFHVKLLADGEEIAQRAFFQPIDPENCENCAENATTNIDFRLPQEDIVDKTLTIRIDLATPAEGTDAAFPLSRAGDPTINARLLVQDY